MELRVGILCNGLVFREWEARCIRLLKAVPGVRVVVLVRNGSDGDDKQTGRPDPSRLRRLLTYPWHMVLYLQYRKRFFKPRLMALVDLSEEFAGVPIVSCRPDRKGHGEHFTQQDIAAIAAHAPDVLLRFGFNIIRGAILQLPRFGVWSFHHGDELKYRGGPPGFWETMHGDPVTGAILQRLTDRLDGGVVLRKGWFNTIDHSLQETVDTVLSASAHWPAGLCKELLAGRTQVSEGIPSSTTAPIFKYPRNVTFLRFLWKQASNKLRFHRDAQRKHEQWNIGILHQPIASLLEDKPNLNIRWLPEPGKGQFRADPFGYILNGELNVLYEKFDYRTGLGEISRLRPKSDNVLKRSRSMLDTGAHLSYPFIVQRNDAVYCVPESAASGTVELYKVHVSNESLDHVCTLLNEPLVDPTLFEHGGFWWLLGTKAPLTNVELFAYWSRDMKGPFVPHLLNPIKHDVRSSRPAGTPFVRGTELWRPAQDSSNTYGGRIAFNRIDVLTPEAFSEVTVKWLDPFKGTSFNKGLHTVSAIGNITLVDGKRYFNAEAQGRRELKRKMSRLRDRNR
ncbi:MAG: hypothetical protein IPG74_03735 [Flavobacteriales bacterium]|nr:hypothetical protein [Flavobacteriales bacterium]